MIRYSCDLCRREIDPDLECRYVVKIEVSAAFDPTVDDEDDDRDHLEEIQELLCRLEADERDGIFEPAVQNFRFDLCPECRKRFLRNPLGRDSSKILDFSQN
ncbi:hypothetical protein JCM19992_34160 [Thermostilla marina]